MDLDAYIEAHAGDWIELNSLVSKRSLTPAEADRLIDLYQQVGTHLSVLRTNSPDPTVVSGLSNLLARARRRIGQARVPTWAAFRQFFTGTFPGALYRMRRWWIGVAIGSFALATAIAIRLIRYPEIEDYFGSPGEIKQLVDVEFEAYYHSAAASSFALRVWTNNVWVSALCIALGVLGLPVLYLLFDNFLNLGIWAGVMANHDRFGFFLGLILPHGLLELTAVCVAGGAGLRLFWSWVAPGNRTRMAAIAHEGRSTLTIALGLIAVLAVSGLIEAFVTPSGLPTAARVAIGVIAWAGFLWYALVLGRQAFLRGSDGDVDVVDRDEEVIAVA